VRELIAWTETLCAVVATAIEEAERLQAEARSLRDIKPAAPRKHAWPTSINPRQALP
jgi:hypothetical protein